MKKVLFVFIWVSIAGWLLGDVVWNYFPSDSLLGDPLYRNEANINVLIILAFYIAWRVTPDSKR